MDPILLLSAFGVGTLISIPFQYSFNERAKRKTILFQEKKEAFVGLLTAYHKAAVEPCDKHSKEFAYWQIRCELLCSKNTKEAITAIVETNKDMQARMVAHEEMKKCLSYELRREL